ncbi:RHS repeat-associated core domain-containing protein [Sorangium sp. So ce1036]|uniref:RHS repeat-associated core domain-containing protein n=1 Tax=Sorangium sp. So ce1036 TaxID=3133328 RepID=UPI003F1282BA
MPPGAAPERFHYEPFGRPIEADGSAWTGSWTELTLGFAGVEHAPMGLIQMGGRAYDPDQRRFLSPDPLVSDPYFDQARHRYSYAHNNPATLTDPTGYWVPPAWLCGVFANAGALTVDSVQLSFGSYTALGEGPASWPQVRTTLPDLTPDSYRTPTPTGVQFTGPGYAGGDAVARALIDYGVDAWLQENGDTAINVSLGISTAALTVATYGMAAEAGVLAAASARIASFGATSWRAITGVAGVIGEGARRYGNQVTRWGAQVVRGAGGGADAAAPSLVRAAPTLSADMDLLAQYGPAVPTQSGGYFNIVSHADASAAYVIRGGQWLSVSRRALAKFIQRSAGYNGQPVRLIACNSGLVRLGSQKILRTNSGLRFLLRRTLSILIVPETFGLMVDGSCLSPGCKDWRGCGLLSRSESM